MNYFLILSTQLKTNGHLFPIRIQLNKQTQMAVCLVAFIADWIHGIFSLETPLF